jgi:hypothetical protein
MLPTAAVGKVTIKSLKMTGRNMAGGKQVDLGLKLAGVGHNQESRSTRSLPAASSSS